MKQFPQYSMQQYLNIRSAYAPSYSASGNRLAFLTDITGTPQVWMVNPDRKAQHVLWPDQLTFSDERVQAVSFSPVDENLLLFVRDRGGNENGQLFLLSLDTGQERPLSEGMDEVMHIPGSWAPCGRSFLFAANRRHPGLFDVYLQPLDREARLVWENPHPGFIFNMNFSPDGSHALVMRMASSYHHDLFEIDIEAKSARQLSDPARDAVYDWADYGGAGSLLLTTDVDSDFVYLARMDRETGKITPLVQEDADIELACLSPDRKHLAYAVNRAGISEVHVLDLETGKQYIMPSVGRGPGMLFGMTGEDSLRFTPGSDALAIAYTGACTPTNVWQWDWQAGTLQPLTRSAAAGIHPESFVAPELVQLPTFDTDPATGQTRQIPAWLYLPRDTEGPLPVVIQVHGGPEGQYRPNLNAVAQYLVQQGFAVLATNVRGSTGYGKTYSHLDDVEKRMDSVNDLAHAALWLKSQPRFAPDRIAVIGASYGGFMVLSALTTYPDLWAAGVDIVGISNFVTFLENTSEYRRAHRSAEYGSLEKNREFLESISPSNHLDQIQVPLFVIHGTNDPRVPVTETRQIINKLQMRGVPVQSMFFDDEGHGLVKLKNKLAAYPEVAVFLKKHLKVGGA